MAECDMGLRIIWRSQRGALTPESRDYCGIGLRDDGALCIVLDGATAGADSGALASAIARGLIDWFIQAELCVPDTIVGQLRAMHSDLSARFRDGSASYVIAHLNGQGAVLVLHAGDCLAGIQDAGDIIWQTRPHTLANPIEDVPLAQIAGSHLRHRLTRSYRPRAFIMPDYNALTTDYGQALILATDGLWAQYPLESQQRFLEGGVLPENGVAQDDCSALLVLFTDDDGNHVSGHGDENLYVARS